MTQQTSLPLIGIWAEANDGTVSRVWSTAYLKGEYEHACGVAAQRIRSGLARTASVREFEIDGEQRILRILDERRWGARTSVVEG